MYFKLKKGLDLPLKGKPDARIDADGQVTKVAVLGSDYIGLKPTMLVQTGDTVKVGTALFEDKKNPGVFVTSPAAGLVSAINRGGKRALVSIEVDVQGDEAEQFPQTAEIDLASLPLTQVCETLQKSEKYVVRFSAFSSSKEIRC